MTKIYMLLPIVVLFLANPTWARDPLLMSGTLGDGVSADGWATDRCVVGESKEVPYKEPEISYTVENTKKNENHVVEIKAQVAFGEVQLQNPKLSPQAKELKASNPQKFEQICGKKYFSKYVYGAVVSIARALQQAPQTKPAPLYLQETAISDDILRLSYPIYLHGHAFKGTYMHMNPVMEDLLSPDQPVEKVLEYVDRVLKNKGEFKNRIRPVVQSFKGI